jgi:hypothetical protein
VDGPAKGQATGKHWERMLDLWYEGMGYDRKTGRPRPETLRALGLDALVTAVWGKGGRGRGAAKAARPRAVSRPSRGGGKKGRAVAGKGPRPARRRARR